MGKGGVVVVVVVLVVVTVVLVVKTFFGPFYFGTRETDFGHFAFGTSSDWALVFEPETFRCFGLKIGKFQIRFGKTRRGRLLYLSSRHFDVLALKSVLVRPYISTFLDG